MQRQRGKLIFSPSDLTRFMESPFASWMDRLALEFPQRAPERDTGDALLGALQKKGYAHEAAVEADFRKKGLKVITIAEGAATEKTSATLTAMRDGVDIIIQARLEQDGFAGFADFLVKTPGASNLGDYHYSVWDTKLASVVKPTFAVQLCCYAEMLQGLQRVLPETLTVALGTGELAPLPTRDFFYYYLHLKQAFLNAQQHFDADQPPDPADSKSWGDWSEYAQQLLVERDHLSQVAGITSGQIKKLSKAGITTMQQLVDNQAEHIASIQPPVLQRLQAQAAIQKSSMGQSVPKFEILSPPSGETAGLALLPPHSPLDVFLDIEGYPLQEGGLEYLWGCSYFDAAGKRDYIDFWAHDSEQEQAAFQQFIGWVFARWQRDPDMHIYHYANYEIAACRKLMGRYGLCELEVDQLLRNEVFVDLYKIVKGSLLLGEPRYSIKNVEHLYRPGRDTEVGSGADSVVVYEQWRDLHAKDPAQADWQTSELLKSLRDYNIDDCDSTQELTEWLRARQSEHAIVYRAKTAVVEPKESEETTARTQLRDLLLERAAQQSDGNAAQAALTENLAWTLEFHRREAKPVFWRLFDRLGLDEEELLAELDCLAACQRSGREPFKPSPRARNLAYEYCFDPTQEFKGASENFYLLGVETDDGKQAKAAYLASESDLENGKIVLQAKQEPPLRISLVPDEYVNPTPIPQAIDRVVSDYAAGTLGRCAIVDFLSRARPVIKGHQGGAIAPDPEPEQRLQQIIRSVKNLDSSYLVIQGPPGSGKTYTAKHVIAELVKQGAKIGIASNSHKAINNLLLGTAQYCGEQGIAATFACSKETDAALLAAGVSIVKNNELSQHICPGIVIGTTAWGFAREDMAGELDYLFVDEAGQVSVANLVGMSRCAHNLVLIGDQMQLGQPSQGTHPADSGLSILDYLLHDAPTIAADLGVFLGTTYRMHSAVNRFISTHVYAGELQAHPANDQRIIEVPPAYQGKLTKTAGIVFVPVLHAGNTQAADEEVAEIRVLANEMLGRSFHELPGQSRPIGWNDMLFVAPYNHQVRKLKQALGEQARVGSVDKFQGQEAPVVLLSMCASDANESPRGLEFLFDRQRLNVAISRALTLAVVVASPRLHSTNVNRVDQLKRVNLFNALCAE